MSPVTTKQDEYALWNKHNDMVLSWILNSLTLDITYDVNFSTTAQEVWQYLLECFLKEMPLAFFILRETLLVLFKIR